MTKKTKLKSAAAVVVPQSKADCQAQIKRLGDVQRTRTRAQADLNDEISKLVEARTPALNELQAQAEGLQQGVQIWCEANRDTLCGRGKTANLVTGEVAWRQRPPSVRVTGQDAVVEALLERGLARFVRIKQEVNKEAILADPEAVAGVPGVHVSSGVEDFVVTPFEVDTEGAAA